MKNGIAFGYSNLVVLFVLFAIAIFSGLIAAQGAIFIAILLVAILFSPIIIAISTETLIAWTLAFGFIFSGLIQYFGKIDQIHWVVAGLFFAMFIRVPFELLSSKHRNAGLTLNTTSWCLIALCAMVIASAIINGSPFFQAFVGFKHYIFPLGLAAVIYCSQISSDYLLSIWRWIPKLLIIQLPIVLYQFLFVAKRRNSEFASQGISWDAIVGSFGGNQDGGGASGAMALFLCFGIVATLALHRERLISNSLSWMAVISALIVIALAEVKVVVVFLPLAVLAYYRGKIFSSAVTAIVWVLGTAVFVSGLLYLYSMLHWSNAGLHLESFDKIFEYIFKSEGDVEFRNRLTGELSRSAALLFWWRENISNADFLHAIFGYGPAASKISASFGYGEAARNYQFQLNTSTLSAMLWDVGLIGTFLYFFALASSIITSFKTANEIRSDNPVLSTIFEGCGTGALLLAFDLPYNLDIMNNPGIQMLGATIFGIVLLKGRLLKNFYLQQEHLRPVSRLAQA